MSIVHCQLPFPFPFSSRLAGRSLCRWHPDLALLPDVGNLGNTGTQCPADDCTTLYPSPSESVVAPLGNPVAYRLPAGCLAALLPRKEYPARRGSAVDGHHLQYKSFLYRSGLRAARSGCLISGTAARYPLYAGSPRRGILSPRLHPEGIPLPALRSHIAPVGSFADSYLQPLSPDPGRYPLLPELVQCIPYCRCTAAGYPGADHQQPSADHQRQCTPGTPDGKLQAVDDPDQGSRTAVMGYERELPEAGGAGRLYRRRDPSFPLPCRGMWRLQRYPCLLCLSPDERCADRWFPRCR